MPKPPPKITFQLDEPRARRGNSINKRFDRTIKTSSPTAASFDVEESTQRLTSPQRAADSRLRSVRKLPAIMAEEAHPHRQPHQNNNMLLSFTKNLDTPPRTPPPSRETIPPVVKPPVTQTVEEQPKVAPTPHQRTVHSSSSFANRLRNDLNTVNEDTRARAGSNQLADFSFPQPISPIQPHQPITKTSSPDVSYSQPNYSSHMSGLNYNTSFETGVKSPALSPTGVPQGYDPFESSASNGLVFSPREAYLANGPLNAIATSSAQDFVAVAGREGKHC